MHFSSYSNLNDKSISLSPVSKNQYKLYQIKKLKKTNPNESGIEMSKLPCKGNSPSDSNNNNTPVNTNASQNSPDLTKITSPTTNSVQDISSGSFATDSQFMQYQSSYNNLFNYQQKSNFARSDSLISLSSQVDLATIENKKIFSPIENSSSSSR